MVHPPSDDPDRDRPPAAAAVEARAVPARDAPLRVVRARDARVHDAVIVIAVRDAAAVGIDHRRDDAAAPHRAADATAAVDHRRMRAVAVAADAAEDENRWALDPIIASAIGTTSHDITRP